MSSILESLNSYRHEMLKHRQKNNNLISSSKGSLFYKSPGVLNSKRKNNWSPVIKDHNAWKSKLGIALSLSKNERRDQESPNKIKFSVDSEGLNSHRSSKSLGIWRFCSPKKRIKTYRVDSAKLLYDRVTAYLEKHFKSGKSGSPLEPYKLPLRTDTYLSKKQRLENIKINLEKKFQEREEKLKAKQSNEDKTLFFTPQKYSEIELSQSPEELNEILDIQLSVENKARLNETFNSNILTPREYESAQLEDGFLDKLSSDSISLAPPSSCSSRFDKEKNIDSGCMASMPYEKLIGMEIICRYCFKVIIQAFDGFKNSYSFEEDDDFFEYFIFDKPLLDYDYLEEPNYYDEEANIETIAIYKSELDEHPASQTINKLTEDYALYEDKSYKQNDEIFEYRAAKKQASSYNYLEESNDINKEIEYSIMNKQKSGYNYLEASIDINKEFEYSVLIKPKSDYDCLSECDSSQIEIEYSKGFYNSTITYSIINPPLADYSYLKDLKFYGCEKKLTYHIINKPIADCNYMEDCRYEKTLGYQLTNKTIADYNYLKDYSSFEQILSKVFNKSSFHYNSLKVKYWSKFSSCRVISYFVLNKPRSYFNILKDDAFYQQTLSQALNKLNSHYHFIKKKYWSQWLCSYIFTLSSLSSENELTDISMHKETISKALNNFNAYYAFLNSKYWEKWAIFAKNSMLKEKSIRKIARSIYKSQGKLKFSFFLKLLSYVEKRKYALCVFKTLFHKREKQIIDFWRQISSKTPIVNNELLFIEELNLSTSHIDSEAVDNFYKPLEFIYKSRLRTGFSSFLSLFNKIQKPPVNLSNISIYKYRLIKEKIEKFLACLENKASKTSNIYFYKWKSL
ncbi:unnamed protein product [Blepharisma stoltei]|uniref:Uncharacterized protein n=1 Tax=Blepharisma stoltei TaxID=1481888 RepID=A0AAU9IL15_9CILI|nr:unnamed protein product [Blepharisma stoltei]